MQIQSNTGRALDISGAFLFAGLFLGCLMYGHNIFAVACGISCLAFISSWRSWDAPDDVEVKFNLTMCALMSLIAAVVFAIAIIAAVLA